MIAPGLVSREEAAVRLGASNDSESLRSATQRLLVHSCALQ